MTQPFVLTFAMQKSLWKLVREYGESCAEVALHPAREAKPGWEKAGRSYAQAEKNLAAFVESISEKPAKPQRKAVG